MRREVADKKGLGPDMSEARSLVSPQPLSSIPPLCVIIHGQALVSGHL